LKKLSSFVWTDSSAFLNAMCLWKYILNYEQHFPFFISQSGLAVTGLTRVYYMSESSCFVMALVSALHDLSIRSSVGISSSCWLQTGSSGIPWCLATWNDERLLTQEFKQFNHIIYSACMRSLLKMKPIWGLSWAKE
jgi:hypothetical protein